jgi:hypothetical protein
MVVVGFPELGDALPMVNVGLPCDAPLQLAASTDPARMGMSRKPAAITIAKTIARDSLRLTGGRSMC